MENLNWMLKMEGLKNMVIKGWLISLQYPLITCACVNDPLFHLKLAHHWKCILCTLIWFTFKWESWDLKNTVFYCSSKPSVCRTRCIKTVDLGGPLKLQHKWLYSWFATFSKSQVNKHWAFLSITLETAPAILELKKSVTHTCFNKCCLTSWCLFISLLCPGCTFWLCLEKNCTYVCVWGGMVSVWFHHLPEHLSFFPVRYSHLLTLSCHICL